MRINILNKILFLTLLSIFFFQFYLNAQEVNKSSVTKTDTAWKYLGRPRPGMSPLRFPPDSLLGNINWFWHGSPMFSPDFKEMFWSKYTIYPSYQRTELVFVKYENNHWISMQNASFGNLNYSENNPFFSITGDTLFFQSQRPGGFIFRVIRNTSGWSQPVPLNISIPSGFSPGMQFSMAKNGTLYFELWNNSPNSNGNLYKSRLVNGQYQTPENLGNMINTESNEFCPYIDPDERFLLFISNRPGGYGLHDIYISSRRPDSTWNNPVNLGPTINSSFEDVFPNITPDSLYFFFTTAKYGDIGYNPYWVSAQYIYNLVSVGIKETSTLPNDFYLEQNYPNPFNPVTKIKFSIPSKVKRETSDVKLVIYDILGKEITTLIDEQLQPGTYEVTFDARQPGLGSELPGGVYFYRIQAGDFSETKKMLMIK